MIKLLISFFAGAFVGGYLTKVVIKYGLSLVEKEYKMVKR